MVSSTRLNLAHNKDPAEFLDKKSASETAALRKLYKEKLNNDIKTGAMLRAAKIRFGSAEYIDFLKEVEIDEIRAQDLIQTFETWKYVAEMLKEAKALGLSKSDAWDVIKLLFELARSKKK